MLDGLDELDQLLGRGIDLRGHRRDYRAYNLEPVQLGRSTGSCRGRSPADGWSSGILRYLLLDPVVKVVQLPVIGSGVVLVVALPVGIDCGEMLSDDVHRLLHAHRIEPEMRVMLTVVVPRVAVFIVLFMPSSSSWSCSSWSSASSCSMCSSWSSSGSPRIPTKAILVGLPVHVPVVHDLQVVGIQLHYLSSPGSR